MEVITYVIIGLIALFFGSKFFKRGDSDLENAIKYHKVDAKLKTQQQLKQARLAELKRVNKEKREAAKLQNPEEIEKWWRK